MVYDKAKSGDPDFDDKVPLEAHQGGETVTDADGNTARVTEANGPIKPDGSHASLDEKLEDGDNRPAPGAVATEHSSIQVASQRPNDDGKAEPVESKGKASK